MKICKRLMLALTAVVLAGCAVVSILLLRDTGRIQLKETILRGSAETVRDLEFIMPVTYDQKINWQSRICPGTEAVTRYQPVYRHKNRPMGTVPSPRVLMNFAIPGEFAPEQTADLVMQKMVEDVAFRAPAGQEYTETVKLADWLDFYELDLHLDFMTEDETVQEYKEPELKEAFEEQLKQDFKFPVHPSQTVNVVIEKDPEGKILRSEILRNPGESMLYEEFALTPNKYWTVPIAKDPEGQLLDYSHVAGGYGLYCVEATPETKPTIKKVLDLGTQEEVFEVSSDKDGQRVLVLTKQPNGECRIYVMDANTEKLVQQLELGVQRIPHLVMGEDWAVLVSYPEELGEDSVSFTLLLRQGEGYQVRYTVKDSWQDLGGEPGVKLSVQLAPDRERLAVAASTNLKYAEQENSIGCGFVAVVYDETGSIYAADFENSLDLARCRQDEQWKSCYPDYSGLSGSVDFPPQIHWKE